MRSETRSKWTPTGRPWTKHAEPPPLRRRGLAGDEWTDVPVSLTEDIWLDVRNALSGDIQRSLFRTIPPRPEYVFRSFDCRQSLDLLPNDPHRNTASVRMPLSRDTGDTPS